MIIWLIFFVLMMFGLKIRTRKIVWKMLKFVLLIPFKILGLGWKLLNYFVFKPMSDRRKMQRKMEARIEMQRRQLEMKIELAKNQMKV